MVVRKDGENNLESQDQQKIVEVPINLELLNQKLNYIISILER